MANGIGKGGGGGSPKVHKSKSHGSSKKQGASGSEGSGGSKNTAPAITQFLKDLAKSQSSDSGGSGSGG